MNVQRFVIAVSAALGVAALLNGCVSEDKPVAGVIAAPTRPAIGRPVPDFPVTTAAGDSTTFNKIRKPVSILAFVRPSDDTCCQLDSKLGSLAARLSDRPITVAQVSEPADGCPHGVGCVSACNTKASGLVSLCDVDHLAWNIYRPPEPNTVFLIDYRGRLAHVAPLTDLEGVAAEARRLAAETEGWWLVAFEY